MPTVIDGDFEWDEGKAEANLEKHGISFDEAQLALVDPFAVDIDDGSSVGRVLVIGLSTEGRLLSVICEPRGERERIISARRATRNERRLYERGA